MLATSCGRARPWTPPAAALALVLQLAALGALASQTLPCQLPLPPRQPSAPTGRQLASLLAALRPETREQRLYEEILQGNVPWALRALTRIRVGVPADSSTHTIEFACTPDVLAVGSDEDFFRVPMTPILAQSIADALDCSLPTPRMVDLIWDHAEWKLVPEPIPPSPEMISVAVFWRHHQMIESQRRQVGAALGALTAGIKKDIVVTARLATTPPPPRVAIYGWHFPSGRPIQPLSLVHEATYVDYSHGVRLVANDVLVDGRRARLAHVLADPLLAFRLSEEAPLTTATRYQALPLPSRSDSPREWLGADPD